MPILKFPPRLILVAVTIVSAAPPAEFCRADDAESVRRRGELIYRQQCANCHGAKGEGNKKKHPDPLVGDATVGSLAKLIAETMPEDEPQKCVGKDATVVAEYIHYAFYSEAARIRNRPPRVGLARLTGPQLRHSLADLYAHFGGNAGRIAGRGVKGVYFDGARGKNDKKKIDRIDKVLEFDFGDKGPGAGIDPKDFYIRWQGGVKANATGRYELVIRCSCAFVFNLGGQDREFINNRVQSGNKTEFRRSVVLTAGRVYPLRIDFWQRKRKTKQPPARIALSWVPPHAEEELIPAANLVQFQGPPTFSLQTKLPPDDRSFGYDRGVAIDRQWNDSTTNAALEFAQHAVQELWPHYRRQNRKISDKNRGRLKRFLREVVETAFRGPINAETRKLYVDNQVDATPDDAEAITRSVLVTLSSPRFLYPLLDADRKPSARAATRLALTLFDSLPSDKWLIDLARAGKLKNAAEIRNAAKRMLSDYRVRGKTRQWLQEWLNLSHIKEISKDDRLFPGFDSALASELRSSFESFLDDVVWSDASDYRQFFQTGWAFTSDRLAKFYGDSWKPVKVDEATGLRKTTSDPGHRTGILTHPYLMSGLAYRDSTSPIHRGVFLIRHMLGRTLRPPQEAFTPLSPKLHPDLTTRQRVELQTSPQGCQVCHTRINGLGFTLENYDAVGRYRTSEKKKVIQAAGHYTTRANQRVKLKGPGELAKYLATSEEAHRAFVRRAFQYFVKQPVAAYGRDTLDRLVKGFRKSNYHIQQLLVEIAVVAAAPPQTPQSQSTNAKDNE